MTSILTTAEMDEAHAAIRDVLMSMDLEVDYSLAPDLIPDSLLVHALEARDAGAVVVVIAAEVAEGYVKAAVVCRSRAG